MRGSARESFFTPWGQVGGLLQPSPYSRRILGGSRRGYTQILRRKTKNKSPEKGSSYSCRSVVCVGVAKEAVDIRTTLEDLYYGNITPSEQRMVPGSEMKKAADRVTSCENSSWSNSGKPSKRFLQNSFDHSMKSTASQQPKISSWAFDWASGSWRSVWMTTTAISKGEANNSGILKINRTLHREKGGRLVTGDTKTYAGTRKSVLPPSTAELLRERKRKSFSPWIFHDLLLPEAPLNPDSAYRQLKKFLAEAGLPNIRFHDLRPTFAGTWNGYQDPVYCHRPRLQHHNAECLCPCHR